MKNKTALYVSIGVLVIVLLGGFLVVKGLKKEAPPPPQEVEQVELSPADPSIVVDLKPKAAGTAVVLSISSIPSGTESVEYELSYLNEAGLPKGALGKIELEGKTEVEREILLGTCSRNVCTYDKGVTSVKLVLRFNHPDGASQFSKEYPLE